MVLRGGGGVGEFVFPVEKSIWAWWACKEGKICSSEIWTGGPWGWPGGRVRAAWGRAGSGLRAIYTRREIRE